MHPPPHALAAGAATLGDDLAHHLLEADPGPVALAERGERQVRVEVGDGRDAALQRVVHGGELLRHPLAELAAEEAVAGGVVGEHPAVVDEINLAGVAPAGDALLHLLDDDLAVGAHAPVLEGREEHLELLVHLLRRGVVDDVLAEDRRHDLVRLGGVELGVRGAEHRLVGLGAEDGDHPATDDLDGGHGAQLALGARQKADGGSHELDRVAHDGSPPERSGGSRSPAGGAARRRRMRGRRGSTFTVGSSAPLTPALCPRVAPFSLTRVSGAARDTS